MLTLTGVAIGLVVTFVPGHAGPDPATIELGGPPIPVAVLPGIALAIVLALAGGVSLGPENPIIGITIGLSVAVGTRLIPGIGGRGVGRARLLGDDRGDVRDAGRGGPRPERGARATRRSRSGTGCSRPSSRRVPAR